MKGGEVVRRGVPREQWGVLRRKAMSIPLGVVLDHHRAGPISSLVEGGKLVIASKSPVADARNERPVVQHADHPLAELLCFS